MESDQHANLVWFPGTHTVSDSGYLTGLRIVQGCMELRQRFLASPMLDPKRYTQDLSDALNTIHRLWRGQSDSGPIDINSTACEPKVQEITTH
ncbi:MAG: hypothetical protein IIC50_10855 [Planctomycetes bacterium]|nr:hypothetical protein [Planctomycetota bacterium]